MPERKSKILIIDDHRLFSDGIKSLLETEAQLELVGQIFDGKDAMMAVRQLSPDIIFMDIHLPNINGLDLCGKIINSYPEIKIMMLTMYDDFVLMDKGRKLGAHAYILKNSTQKELLEAIEAVTGNKKWFDTKIKIPGKDVKYKEDIVKKHTLTTRELEILGYIRDGLASQEISEKMSLSYLTIKTHRRNIHFKLGTNSTAALIKFANDNLD